jgi:hypothetical protein
MRPLNRTLQLALLAIVTTRAPAQSTAPIPDSAFANRIAGCYTLVPGPWQHDSAIHRIRAVPSGPISFELRREIVSGHASDALHRAISDSLAGYPHGLYSIWTRIRADSNLIRIGQPFLYADFALRVSPDSADLVGDFVAYGPGSADVVNSARAPVTARRVACAAGGG